MSLIDDVRRTVTDAANTALEKGQQAADLVRLQAKLQQVTRERGRRMHELGARTYDWFQSGTMVVTGPVPPNVVELCSQISTLNVQVDETQRLFDEAKSRATSLPDASQTSSDTPLDPPVSTPTTAVSSSTPSISSSTTSTSGTMPLPPTGGTPSQSGPSDP
jgi:hypothetical protein